MRRKEKSARERESETTVSARGKNPFEFRTIDVDFQCGYAKLLIL